VPPAQLRTGTPVSGSHVTMALVSYILNKQASKQVLQDSGRAGSSLVDTLSNTKCLREAALGTLVRSAHRQTSKHLPGSIACWHTGRGAHTLEAGRNIRRQPTPPLPWAWPATPQRAVWALELADTRGWGMGCPSPQHTSPGAQPPHAEHPWTQRVGQELGTKQSS